MSNEQRNHEQQEQQEENCNTFGNTFGTRLDEVQEEELRWMWDGYLVSGKLNGLNGDADKGKSLMMLDIAARVSRGWPMPLTPDDDPSQERRPQVCEPGNVLLLCGEDGPADTIVPRLRIAGADLAHIFLLESYPDRNGKQQFINFADPLAREYLIKAIEYHDARLLIIDPLATFMGKSGDTDLNKEQDVRVVLTAFTQAIAHTNCCVWAIRHRGKDSKGREPVHRALGSTAITAIFRAEWGVDTDPQDDNQRVFSKVKNNLSISMPSLSFHIEDTGGEHPKPFIVWDGTSIWDGHSLGNVVETFSPRQYVKQVLAENNGRMPAARLEALIQKDEAYKASKKPDAIRNVFHQMRKAGELAVPIRGQYELPTPRLSVQMADYQKAA